MQEREINLVDLLVEILLRWRTFLVWMLCGALLLGAVGYARTWRAAKTQEAQVEEARRQLEKKGLEGTQGGPVKSEQEQLQEILRNLTDEQVQTVDEVLEYEALYQEQLDYQESSLYLQMDADNVYRGKMIFSVVSEDKVRAYSIEPVYESVVTSGELVSYLMEHLDLPASVVEVVSLQSNSAYRAEGTDCFSILVSHYDKQVCGDMVHAVIDFVEEKHKEIAQTMGEHEIVLADLAYATVHDSDVTNYKQSYLAALLNQAGASANWKANFTDEQWEYYDIMTNSQLTDRGSEETETSVGSLQEIVELGVTITPGISLKYVILGMLLAAFVYAFWIFMMYAMNTRVRASDELQQIYGIPQLGLIPGVEKKKKLMGFVDQWILALRDRNKRKFSRGEALSLVSVAVKMAMGRNGLQTVYLCGCDLKDQGEEICRQIGNSLEKEHMQVVIANNLLYDAASMNSLEHAQGVVLVEKAGSTLYTEIAQELEVLKREEIKVLGVILVE